MKRSSIQVAIDAFVMSLLTGFRKHSRIYTTIIFVVLFSSIILFLPWPPGQPKDRLTIPGLGEVIAPYKIVHTATVADGGSQLYWMKDAKGKVFFVFYIWQYGSVPFKTVGVSSRLLTDEEHPYGFDCTSMKPDIDEMIYSSALQMIPNNQLNEIRNTVTPPYWVQIYLWLYAITH